MQSSINICNHSKNENEMIVPEKIHFESKLTNLDELKINLDNNEQIPTESTIDTTADLAERVKQFNVGRFNHDKMKEIEDAMNMFNFDLNDLEINHNQAHLINQNYNHAQIKRKKDSTFNNNTNPLLRDLQSTSKFKNAKKESDDLNMKSISKARALAKE